MNEEEEKPCLLIKGTKILKYTKTPWFSGWQDISTDEAFRVSSGAPGVNWQRSRIPFELWSEMVGFLRWSQKEFKSEAMIVLFYNETEDKWAAWPLPQLTNGMTVRLNEHDPLYAQDRARFDKDWTQLGTIHHHCTSGAFQSATDLSDEEDREGVHITLGKMESPKMDSHIRVTFLDFEIDPTVTRIADWVEYPEWFVQIPEDMHELVFGELLLSLGETSFPEEWKSRIRKGGYAVVQHSGAVGQRLQPKGAAGRTSSKGANSGKGAADDQNGIVSSEELKIIAVNKKIEEAVDDSPLNYWCVDLLSTLWYQYGDAQNIKVEDMEEIFDTPEEKADAWRLLRRLENLGVDSVDLNNWTNMKNRQLMVGM